VANREPAKIAPLPVGISVDELVATYPRLYHLTHVDNWDLIQRIGLLSTSALLDLFGIDGETRRVLEASNRRELVPIRSDTYGVAILRDQKPMDDRGLGRALQDGISPEEWYRTVNQHVFFWVDRGRVERLLGARAYRHSRHALLVARTRDILDRYHATTVLSPINTGATKPMPHPRGTDCFVPLPAYPFAHWYQKRKGRDAVVEFAVRGTVENVMEAVEDVSIVGAGEANRVIYRRP